MAEQIDHLPQGWTKTAVDRVGSVRLGRQLSPDKKTGRFNTKYLRAANITSEGLDLSEVLEMDFTASEREVYALRPGDVVLAEASGSPSQVGRSAIWSGEIPGCCFQNTVIRFRPHATEPEYALIVFQHYAESGALQRVARGVGIQHLGASRFAQMPFPLPPRAEQIRIAEEFERRNTYLGGAERALRAALARIEEQDREIRAAAVRGLLVEAEGLPLSRVSVPPSVDQNEKSQADLFGVGEEERAEPDFQIPAHWTWAKVRDVGELKLGRQRSPKHARGENRTPYLRVGNVTAEGLDLTDVREMDFTPEEQAIYALQVGDIVVVDSSGSPAQVGRPALWKGELPLCCYQNHLIRFRPHSVEPEFALLVFRHYAESGIFGDVARGMGIQHLGLGRFAEMAFPLPSVDEQRRILGEATPRLTASRSQEAVIRTSLERVREMKAELLTAAVSGSLVPQHDTDESAEALLSRLGPPSVEVPSLRSAEEKGEGNVKVNRRRLSETRPTSLAGVLRAADRPLQVTELFALAGYERDLTSDVERFYLKLRTELGMTIKIAAGEGEDALLEATSDAT